MALAFLPLPFVRIYYQNIRNHHRTVAMVTQHPALPAYFAYFEGTWLRANGQFPPNIWNVHDRAMEFRTNNIVESFNHRWDTLVSVRHPSLWVFIRILKDEQRRHEN